MIHHYAAPSTGDLQGPRVAAVAAPPTAPVRSHRGEVVATELPSTKAEAEPVQITGHHSTY